MTNIEWTDETWNPVVGCQRVAAGCQHCYAEAMAKRLAKMGQAQYAAVVNETGWNGKALPVPEQLDKPLRWKKGRRIFVCSMSDLFHEDVAFEYIAAVYGVMAASPQHTFQVLTKRPERMREFFEWLENKVAKAFTPGNPTFWTENRLLNLWNLQRTKFIPALDPNHPWPLPNVWHGTSIATQADADKNIPALLRVPSAVRFISAEPLIGPVELRPWLHDFGCPCGWGGDSPDAKCHECGWKGAEAGNQDPCPKCGEVLDDTDACPQCDLDSRDGVGFGPNERRGPDWVIVGGESGPGARVCDVGWIEDIVEQCKAAGVACFVKQVGSRPMSFATRDFGPPENRTYDHMGDRNYHYALKDRKGGNPEEWPEDLRVRQFPEAP